MGIEIIFAEIPIPTAMDLFGAGVGRLIKLTINRKSSLTAVLCGKAFAVASVINKPISQLVLLTPRKLVVHADSNTKRDIRRISRLDNHDNVKCMGKKSTERCVCQTGARKESLNTLGSCMYL